MTPGTTVVQAMDRAAAAFAAGRLDEAGALCAAILRQAPGHFHALHLSSVLALQRGDWNAAVLLATRALQAQPGNPDVLGNRGAALRNLGRHAEAIADYDRVLAANPGHAAARNNKGVALAALGRHAEALAEYARAVSSAPGYAEAFHNTGVSLAALNRPREAVEAYSRALALEPKHARARLNRALAHLATGNFAHGFADYEWRHAGAVPPRTPRSFNVPRWHRGTPVAGRTVLVHAEQGLGDAIHFARFLAPLHALGARIVLEVAAPLAPLLAQLPAVAAAGPDVHALGAFDFEVPLMSLPFALGTTLDDIPPQDPPLRAPAEHIAKWRARLGEARGLRVGIAWSGNPGFANDAARSIPLSLWRPLWGMDATLISLQKDLRQADLAALGDATPLLRFEGEIGDFRDTAALAALADVVISVDTAAAHLSAAMGRPTWILLPHSPDWRWMLDRDDTPWYPTARLFRQRDPGDWGEVMERVVAALGEFERSRRV